MFREENLEDAEKKLEELEEVLRTMDAEAIKKLSNGVLEKTLNIVLRGEAESCRCFEACIERFALCWL